MVASRRNGDGDKQLLVRLPEAAAMLSMSERACWALSQQGVVPSFKLGRSRFYSVQELEQWVSDQTMKGGNAENN